MKTWQSRIELTNSLTGGKTPLKPLEPGRLGLYVCGMTVYDLCHVGHGRVMVVFDALVRFFRLLDFDVTYVRNITDIDDKIIQRANDRGISTEVLVEETIAQMHADSDAMGLLRPDVEPRATQAIDAMIALIEALERKGFAYRSASGDVLYRVDAFPDYGRLSKKNLEALRAGARVASDEGKDSPLDFVLWKSVKPGEPSWPSPWGDGRPGWHIECSAMSMAHLGTRFDLHGGGVDLKFPHHENEIAQSCAACDDTYANAWLHVGHVQMDQKKMSKSLGNYHTLRDVFRHFAPDAVRLFLLGTHYRHPLEFQHASIEQAQRKLAKIHSALAISSEHVDERDVPPWHESLLGERFLRALCDDFNTPQALSVWYETLKALNVAFGPSGDVAQVASLRAQVVGMGEVLGLLDRGARASHAQGGPDDVQVQAWVDAREQARLAKDWVLADQLREKIEQQGVLLEDTPQGSRWRRQ